MEEEVFSDPQGRLLSLLRSANNNSSNGNGNGNGSSEEDHQQNDILNGLGTIGGNNELAQYLWAQRDQFSSGKFLKLKPLSREISEQQRREIRLKKQFNLNGEIIEAVDDFINIAFQLSDKLSIDEYLACQLLARVVNLTSTRDTNQLLSLCEEYLYQTRSCYLDTLREILNYLNTDSDKIKRDILQMFMCELLSQQNDCLATVLLKSLEDKIGNITVPTNQKESTYRLQECQKIVDCLFMISFQFTLDEESIRSIISKLKEVSKLFSNQQPTNTLYSPLFQITFTLLLNVFVIFVEPKALLMNPHEHKPTINSVLKSNTFLGKVESDISNCWEHNSQIQSTLYSLFYLMKYKVVAEFSEANIFQKERNPAEFLARIVESTEFKNHPLKSFFLFVLDEYCCSFIRVFPINEKMHYLTLLNNFNQLVYGIYSGGIQNSKKYWETAENAGFLKKLWIQIPNVLITSSFRMMAALTVCNGIEVYNFFTKDSSQFTWNKILQDMQFYIESLNQLNSELSPSDTEALNSFLCLITEVINYSPHLAQMLSRTTPILLLFFRYVTAPVSVGLKSTTLKAITACAKYPIYVPDIWKLLNESQIFPSGLRMESQSSEHGEFPFTQQFLELFYQLIQVSPFLFDRSNDNVMKVYLEHIMNLFSSFNNKAFNNILDKWRFTLTILNIFVFCLTQFKSSIINHIIDRKHPVYPLYLELTRESHNLTLQTIINIIETATNENVNQESVSNELFQNTLCRCLDILLFVSDSTVYSLEDAKSIVTHLSALQPSPIISISKLIDHQNREIALKALRLIYSFEIYTQRISSLFLVNSPDEILERFVKVLEYAEQDQEIFATGGYYQQSLQFQQYASNSIQWTIAQLILFCLDKSANTTNYTLAHFLLGCPSTYDLSADFELNSRTCLTVMLRKVSNRDFATRYPHLNDCYHEIIHKMISNPATSKPMMNYLQQNYFRENVNLLRQLIAVSPVERMKEAHISSLSWLLKTMAITGHTTSNLTTKSYFISLLGNSDQNIQVLSLFNAIDLNFPELHKPRCFEISPNLESACIVTVRDCQLINLPLLRRQLEMDGRYSNIVEIDREMESCARLNVYISLLDSKTRALEAWKQFVNQTLIQQDTITSIDEIVPLVMLQRLVVEFANERYPVNCGVSIGYTVLSLLYILKIKKESYPLSTFSETLETKIKGIFEALLQTVLKSPYQPIRGIAYIAIVNYLQLTTDEERAKEQQQQLYQSQMFNNSSVGLNGNGSLYHSKMNPEDAKSIERYNLILLAKVEDRFVRILTSDCNSFSSGWKISALSCLQTLLIMDVHRGNRILKYVEDKGLVGTLITECCRYLSDDWEMVGLKELRLYEAEMSLLLCISQQGDGVRVLMNNNVINCLQQCQMFNYLPAVSGDQHHQQSDQESVFSHLLLPALRLLAGMFLLSNDRMDVYNHMSNFVNAHSDLLKTILLDSHKQLSTSTLETLQLTVYLYTQISKYQAVANNSNLQTNKIHYSLLALLNKYTKFSNFSSIATSSDEEDELKNKVEYTNFKEKSSLFEVQVKNQISLICRDLLLYCRRVSILPDSKFGTICFNSSVVKAQQGSSTLTSMDLPIKYLSNCLIDFYQTQDIIVFLNQNIENVEQLSNLQYKSILQNDSLYQELNVNQRNQLALQKLNEKLNFYQLQQELIVENIETLLVLIVSHAYYYTHHVNYLFTHPFVQQITSTSSPALRLSSSTQSTPYKQITTTNNINNNANGSMPLELSDLTTTPIKQSNTSSQSIFLEKKPTGTQKLMNYFFKSTQNAPSTPPAITSSQINSTHSLSLSQRPAVQSPTSLITPNSNPVLSFDESRDFLTKLRNAFEKEIPSLNKRLYDSILSLPQKSIMVELLMRKLSDLFNKQ